MKAYTLTPADTSKLGDKVETEYTVSDSASGAENLKEKLGAFLAGQNYKSIENTYSYIEVRETCDALSKNFKIYGCEEHEAAIGFIRSLIADR